MHPARQFGPVPAVFIGEKHVLSIGLDAKFANVPNGFGFLRTRVWPVIAVVARPVCDEEHRDTGIPGRVDELCDTWDRIRDVVGVPLFEFPLRHRPLESHLKSCIADRRFIDIENDRRRQVSRIRLSGLGTPRCVFNEARQIGFGRLIDLHRNRRILGCVIYP